MSALLFNLFCCSGRLRRALSAHIMFSFEGVS